jgi:hypothetical protein
MITQLLSQPCKRGSHFFAFQQRFHSLLVDFGPLFANIEALLYFSRRNDNYAVRIRHNQISGVDHEWLGLFGRSELHRAVQSRCPRESVRAQGRRSLCEDLNVTVADQHICSQHISSQSSTNINTTYRKPHPAMLINIAKTPINNNTLRAQILGPRTHQTTPASRVKPFRLRDEHNTVLFDPVGEVLRRLGSRGVVGVY